VRDVEVGPTLAGTLLTAGRFGNADLSGALFAAMADVIVGD
jgi:hypothetical protein